MKIIKLSDNREMASAAAEWFSSVTGQRIKPVLPELIHFSPRNHDQFHSL